MDLILVQCASKCSISELRRSFTDLRSGVSKCHANFLETAYRRAAIKVAIFAISAYQNVKRDLAISAISAYQNVKRDLRDLRDQREIRRLSERAQHVFYKIITNSFPFARSVTCVQTTTPRLQSRLT